MLLKKTAAAAIRVIYQTGLTSAAWCGPRDWDERQSIESPLLKQHCPQDMAQKSWMGQHPPESWLATPADVAAAIKSPSTIKDKQKEKKQVVHQKKHSTNRWNRKIRRQNFKYLWLFCQTTNCILDQSNLFSCLWSIWETLTFHRNQTKQQFTVSIIFSHKLH